ncbi:sigma-54-dependent Fis family transcriptional regulator [Metallumcola ferriviriculae]|uniref:Sigma-54-dependent Fis family transcriptional regulator n=1 Tax=Metallumcola ferriviriculae TaxID=3039180 RepID=A0AAU0UP09_9FIRM|nr:sigma-54-dependent Fis family transcriptional regulator [Desulfitibacteraceae bacterium MK1]
MALIKDDVVKSLDIKNDLVLDSMHNGVVAVDANGIIVVFNKTLQRIYGYCERRVLGRHIEEIIPYTGLLKVLETGKSHIGRKFTIGDAVYLTNRTPIISRGKVIGVIGVIQEITELQSIVEELQMVKDLKGTMETIIETAYDGLIVVNREGIVTMVNNAFASLLGRSAQSVMGKHITEIMENTRMHLVVKNGRAEIGDLQRINGQDVVVMRFPIKKDGRTIGAVGKIMFKDVHDLNALAQKINSLRSELAYYKGELQRYRGAKYGLENIIGDSREVSRLKETLAKVAQSTSTVLITGETGTGKELFAHALHLESNRRYGPFIKVNCAAIPEQLLESELFGYIEGAFTGARKDGQVGKFELADKGSIFLDEIGDMSLPLQAKLLRVLQDKEIERLGDARTRMVDVRVVAATNKNVEELIRKGKFREDLYYRLNVISLTIPPLRERHDDLKILVKHFIDKFNFEFSIQVKGLTEQCWKVFLHHHWPGNVRELENVLERAFNVVEGENIKAKDLPMYLQKAGQSGKVIGQHQSLQVLLEQTEKVAIKEALDLTAGNKVQAASLLGISRAWLYQKIQKYSL